MLRTQLNDALKEAMRARDMRRVQTLRLVNAAIKDGDIDARGSGASEGLDDAAILQLLVKMIRQRRDSIVAYEAGARPDLVQQESEEIAIIEAFLPRQMSDLEVEETVRAAMADLDITGPKDLGRLMAVLKERHATTMNLGRASQIAKSLLG